MKKIILFLISIFIILIFPNNISAQEKNIIIEKEKIINQNPYLITGENIDILGTINGDVIAAGGQINISGKINGDLIAVGGRISISGEITQNVRLGAGQIIISGKIGKNLLIGSGDLQITENATIQGYLVTGSGNISIYAPIGGNVTAGTSNLSIYSNINGNLTVASEQILLSPDANIKGNFEYWNNNDIDTKTKVQGKTIRHDIPENVNLNFQKINPKNIAGELIGLTIGLKILSVISYILIGFLIIKIFPNLLSKVENNISLNTWKSIFAGFLTMIIFPISFIILLVTIVGIPLAFILASIYGIIIYLSKIFVIYWLGGKIINKDKTKYLSFLFASVIYAILLIVPPISGIIKLITTLTGLGACILSCKEVFVKAK